MSKWRWLAVVVLLLLIGLAVVSKTQPRQTVVLPRGASLTYAGVTFGTMQHFPPGQSWTRILSFLPKTFIQKFNLYPPYATLASSNQLVIWFRDTPQNSPFLIIQGPSVLLALVDENNSGYCSPNFFPTTLPGSRAYPSYQGVVLSAFPRRGKSFKLRFFTKDTENKLSPLGEMTIPNPVSKDYPNWPASLLPITSTNAGVEISLTKLLTGKKIFSEEPAPTNEFIWGSAYFTFSRDGKPCADWAVDAVGFSDATGNQTTPSGQGYLQSESNKGVFWFRPPLWPAESAWKLNVHFKRTAQAKFEDTDIWTTPPLALPALSTITNLNLKTTLHGANISVNALVDETAMMPRETQNNERRVRLALNVSSLPPDFQFDIASTTANGEKEEMVTPMITSGSSSTGERSWTYFVPASTRTLTLMLAVYPVLNAEFIAKPTVVGRENEVPRHP